MKAIETKIPSILIIETDVFGDYRGYFTETYNKPKYEALGINTEFVQDNMSFFSSERHIKRASLAEPAIRSGKTCFLHKGNCN